MRRIFLIGFVVGILILSLGGCKSWEKSYEEAAATTFQVNVLKGTPVVGMIKMMEPGIKPNPRLGDTVKYVIEQSPDTLYAKLQAGEIEIAVIPTDMAAKLYNNEGQYQLAAINTKGSMYVLTNGVVIGSLADLKGKEVHFAVPSTALFAVFKYMLVQNGVDPDKDITLKFIEPDQVQTDIANTNKIMVMTEPWVSELTATNSNIKIALDIQKEWNRINGEETPLAHTCLVVKQEVAGRDPEKFGLFLRDYADSIDWVNKKSAEAARLVANHDIGISPEVAAELIPRCNMLYMKAIDAKPAVEKYLKVLQGNSPDSIGGKLPDENFYYQKND
ncbi:MULTISPECIES: ABC transporter substrate-binding protein [unclassified Dehalobacter]|nr:MULTISPECIES: PhnD/SsuA/transferrin family substrate-binding protein [unclassified Dehalobacter]